MGQEITDRPIGAAEGQGMLKKHPFFVPMAEMGMHMGQGVCITKNVIKII